MDGRARAAGSRRLRSRPAGGRTEAGVGQHRPAPRAEHQVDELSNHIVFGIILVMIVLMFTMGLRNSLFVGAAIPLSMLMAFSFLSMFGLTLTVFSTVIGVMAVMLAAGMGLRDSVSFANRAGGIVVGKLGTATVTYEELFGGGAP